MLTLRRVSPGTVALGGRIQIDGTLGGRQDKYVVAIAVRDRDDRDGGLLVRHSLGVLEWNEERLSARVHPEVDPGRGYELLIVCNLTEGRGAAPIFMQCSNVLHIDVVRP